LGKTSDGLKFIGAINFERQNEKVDMDEGNKNSKLEINPETNRIASEVVDSAFKLHSALGPGLLESVYEAFLVHELKLRGLNVDKQVLLPITFEGMILDGGLRLDLLVENRVVVELKAVESILKVHQAQLRTYLKLSGYELGLLINFNVPIIKDGIQRIVFTKKG
jgi:GxxExxY protein